MTYADPMELMELSADEREALFAMWRLEKMLAANGLKVEARKIRFDESRFTPEVRS